MTISYAGSITKLIFRWKGSVWKSVWKELTSFLIVYYAIRFAYFYAMNEEQQTLFERLVQIIDKHTGGVPLTFLLGFYIAIIVKRWWAQFEWVAWPDDILSLVCVILPGTDEQSRLKRHTIARYLVLTAAVSWREVSQKIRLRFPSLDHVVASGLMTENERNIYELVIPEIRWFLPLQWAKQIIAKHAEENPKLVPAPVFVNFSSQLDSYRLCFRKLFCYDWVCIPLVYTQIAAIATYGYLMFCLIGRQFLDPEKKIPGYNVDYFVPVVTIVEFLFYAGWFKIGQDLMRPFGKDDDDIELNYILDRHIQTSFAMVNQVGFEEFPLAKDKFWQSLNPADSDQSTQNGDRKVSQEVGKIHLPHTKVSARLKENQPVLHAKVRLKRPEDAEILELNAVELREKKKKKKDSLSSTGTLSEGTPVAGSGSSTNLLVTANMKILAFAKRWRRETVDKSEKFRHF